ncbi:conserved hypothetical protein [Coccidioides posadasii str. Silveira]|uniref:Uncharacterized protein n=2 Tax=Coccidioides posadasii TaxID=199306 RepID=E9D0T5_COCPS|nr:conserved hypothetical protein [Coccidioides posadasii str. Silveira]KMM73490.1 hypothetical protein CPAG_09779 [Coccidioides posadasii RMSCC 3488]KMM73491.1 hypothetical protein, variant [Coccidioides posadasii RMSCC 3488]
MHIIVSLLEIIMGTWFTAHEFYPYGATNEHTIPACHVLAKICRSIKVRVKKGMPLVFHWLAYGERGVHSRNKLQVAFEIFIWRLASYSELLRTDGRGTAFSQLGE